MSWLSKLFRPEPEVKIAISRPRLGYQIDTDVLTYWKVITYEEKFYYYLEELREKVYGQDRPEGE